MLWPAMAIHYSETADTTERMQGLMTKLDLLGTKRRTKVSNSDSDFSDKQLRSLVPGAAPHIPSKQLI
jgi:hypothetical protein